MKKGNITDCVEEFMTKKFNSLFIYAMGFSGRDRVLSEDSVSFAFSKAYEPDKFCKIDAFWPYNTIRDYIRDYWKKRDKEKKITSFTGAIDEQGKIPDFTEELIVKKYLSSVKEEIISFIRKQYPRAKTMYILFFEIWCYQEVWGYSWEEMQERTPWINMNEVQSRCTEILREFKKYYARKEARWNLKKLFS